jgi:hypothetical protein
MRPLFMPACDGLDKYQQLKRHFAVVDVERQNPFAVVTDDYELVTNKAAYDMAAEVMKKVFHTTQIGDMECLNITMPKTRSFCHIDLIHKTADFSPWEKDKWTAFLRISNSYNRTRLLRFELGFCRWICLNGIIFGSKSIEFSYAHTRRGMDRVDRFVENIGDIRKLETALTEKLHQLKRYHVPEKEMLPLLCRAFDIKATKDVVEKQRRVDDLLACASRPEPDQGLLHGDGAPRLCRAERADGLRVAPRGRDRTGGQHAWPAAEGGQLDGRLHFGHQEP